MIRVKISSIGESQKSVCFLGPEGRSFSQICFCVSVWSFLLFFSFFIVDQFVMVGEHLGWW